MRSSEYLVKGFLSPYRLLNFNAREIDNMITRSLHA
jgi:hypothetical protein